MNHRGRRILAFLLVAGAAATLRAQDPWDASIKLSAGVMSGLADAGISQDKGYSLAMAGSYPLFHARGSVAFEFGYRAFPTTSRTLGLVQEDNSSDGLFATAMYQFRIWPHGIYVQGGMRLNQFKTTRTILVRGTGGEADRWTKDKGPSVKSFKPVLGVGYRLNEHVSLEGNAFGVEMQNAEGKAKSGTAFEVVLVLHL